jgi:hypothetical protein
VLFVRKVIGVVVLGLAALTLTGCSALGLGGGSGTGDGVTPTAPPGSVSDAGWLVSANGSATPSPKPSIGGRAGSTGLPPVSFLPVAPGCNRPWTVDPPLIPMQITPVKGGLTVTWPRQYNSDYKITAIPQPLRTGSQPAYTWKAVPAPAGCLVTTTITGLKSGTPYVVWLDAPNSGYMQDGTRHPYSGESKVVYPL